MRFLCRTFLAISLCLAPTSAVAAEDPASIAAARELFSEGLALSKEGSWQGAREKLAASLELKRARSTLYSLAVAEMSTGQLVASLEHFRAFLAERATESTERFEEPAKAAIEELQKRVGRATIQLQPAVKSPLITLDGKEIARGTLGRPRLVDPGAHELVVEAAGYHKASQGFEVEAGGTTDVWVRLSPLPAPPDGDQDIGLGEGNGPEQPAAESAFPTTAVSLMVGGGAVALAGVVIGIVGYEQAGDAPASEGSEADGARRLSIAADVTMGVGGAAALVGLVLLLVGDESAPASRSAQVAPGTWRLWGRGSVAGVHLSF